MSHEHNSFWGKPTASLDWCESFGILYLHCEFRIVGKNLSIKLPVQLSYLVLGIVGIGSALFHATLLYYCQLLDELPMIYGTLIFLYAIYEFEKKTTFVEHYFVPILTLIGVAITLSMLTHSDNPLIHQFAYAILVFILIFRAAQIYSSTVSPVEKSIFRYFLIVAVCVFGSGYASWITERKLCENGYVLPYVQLHSFWHILTGVGTFEFIQFLTYYRLRDRTTNVEIKFLFGLIPYLDKRNKKQF